MEIFQLEEANLLALKLMDFVHNKFNPLFSTLFRFHDDIKSGFQRDNWKMALEKIRRRSASHYDNLQTDTELRQLYKTALTFYVRNVIKSPEITSIPKLNHFVHAFVGVITTDKQTMGTPVYFNEYKYADRLGFVKSALRRTLYKTIGHKHLSAGAKTVPKPASKTVAKKPPAASPPEQPLSRTSKHSKSVRRSVPASIGPDDSISVAPFSRLQPKMMKIPSMRVPSEKVQEDEEEKDEPSDIKIISLNQ